VLPVHPAPDQRAHDGASAAGVHSAHAPTRPHHPRSAQASEVSERGQSEIITSRPMVLLLGNHSSGKSSFINHLVGSEVQKSGVAPTDDSFTLITSGLEDTDQDGPALVGDPDLGFMALRNFGNVLISHVQLKARSPQGAQHPAPLLALPRARPPARRD